MDELEILKEREKDPIRLMNMRKMFENEDVFFDELNRFRM